MANMAPDVILAAPTATGTATAAESIANAGSGIFDTITSAINQVKDTLCTGPSQIGMDVPPATAEQMMYTGPPPHF
jgi:hypothetical protein